MREIFFDPDEIFAGVEQRDSTPNKEESERANLDILKDYVFNQIGILLTVLKSSMHQDLGTNKKELVEHILSSDINSVLNEVSTAGNYQKKVNQSIDVRVTDYINYTKEAIRLIFSIENPKIQIKEIQKIVREVQSFANFSDINGQAELNLKILDLKKRLVPTNDEEVSLSKELEDFD